MSEKSPAEVGFDSVVIRTWMVEGSGEGGANPRWLSSYALRGTPAVDMRGPGVESQEAAMLAALDAVRAIVHADEWRRVFEWTIYDAVGEKADTSWVYARGAELQPANGHREAAEVAREEIAKRSHHDS